MRVKKRIIVLILLFLALGAGVFAVLRWSASLTAEGLQTELDALEAQEIQASISLTTQDIAAGTYPAQNLERSWQYARTLASSYQYVPFEGEVSDEFRSAVTITTQDWSLHISLVSDLVQMQKGRATEYFVATSKETDWRTLRSYMRAWYDELELYAMQEAASILDEGQDYLTAANACMELWLQPHLEVTTGSCMRYADLSYELTYAPEQTLLSREKKELSEDGYAFYLNVYFLPEPDSEMAEVAVSMQTAHPVVELPNPPADIPEGAYVYTRCIYVTRADNMWTTEIVGTSF